MYSINIDSSTRIINIELSGIMDKEEVERYTAEINSLLPRLHGGEYSMYADLRRLDPVSQDSLPLLIEASRNSLLHFRKIATVHKRTVTKMQMRRIESTAKANDDNIQNKIVRFYTPREAMSYLSD